MLDSTLQSQLKTYLERLVFPIELDASLDDSTGSRELEELLRQIAYSTQSDQRFQRS